MIIKCNFKFSMARFKLPKYKNKSTNDLNVKKYIEIISSANGHSANSDYAF
jgi:hypothetical protein